MDLGDILVLMGKTLGFALIGLIVFALTFYIVVKVVPFSIRKEIEEDHNVALAIVLGAVFIGIAMIVSAAVHG
jgi:putative membrane protein